MATNQMTLVRDRLSDAIFAVPVRIKITGIMVLPILILGFALNYWVRTGLSDWLSYLISDDRVYIAMQAGSRSVIFVTALAAIASVLLTALLMLSLTKPLLELRQAAQRVAEGDIESRARVWVPDEIGEVASAVNSMIDRMVSSQQQLQRSNRRLQAINRVAMAASRALDLQNVLDVSLHTTLEVMGFESGWIFLKDADDPNNHKLRLASSVAVPQTFKQTLIENSDQICSHAQKSLQSNGDVAASMHICEQIKPPTDGNIYHLLIPIAARGQRFGLVNIICPEDSKPSSNDMDTFSTIGSQISEFVANAWLHTTLKEKESARQALLTALVSAQENERARLSRELHDGAGQSLTSLLIRLKTLEKTAAAEGLKNNVSDLCQSTSETIEQIRGISHRLRPAALEEFGLEVALRTLSEEMLSEVGIICKYEIDLQSQRLPFEIETNLYRIAQEGLTNIVRHAEASRVKIQIDVSPTAVDLMIEDDGKGFSVENFSNNTTSRRLGLISIQERSDMISGTLIVKSAPGAGTLLHVRVPLEMETN